MSDAGPGAAGGPPPELRREFWVIVALLNVALLAIALGGLVLLFRSWPEGGWGLLVIGLVALGAAWRRYRRVRGRKA